MTNREIKFRAWDSKNKKYYLMGNCDFFIERDGPSVFNELDSGRTNKNWQLEQFTGLKDSKGVEIYEGDIVQNFHDRTIEVIEWNCDGHFCLCSEKHPSGYGTSDAWATMVSVIGNNHENSELLK